MLQRCYDLAESQRQPKLQAPAQPDDATEHINALGQFARDLVESLHGLASRLRAYRNTDGYYKNYVTSLKALRTRKRRTIELLQTIDPSLSRVLLQSTLT